MRWLEFFAQNQYAIAFYVMGLVLLLLMFLRRLPSVDSLQSFATMLNTRGGNILLLSSLSVYFFIQAMRLFYNLIALVIAGKATADNALGLMALQFATSVAFGGAFGALLKTMTGESPIPVNGNGGNGKPAPPPVVVPTVPAVVNNNTPPTTIPPGPQRPV